MLPKVSLHQIHNHVVFIYTLNFHSTLWMEKKKRQNGHEVLNKWRIFYTLKLHEYKKFHLSFRKHIWKSNNMLTFG